MSTQLIRFPFIPRPGRGPHADPLPLVPMQLALGGRSLDVLGLLDTGATINVLPFSVGLRLGGDWDRSQPLANVGGAFASAQSRLLPVQGTVAPFPAMEFVFVWSSSDDPPVILGQFDFLFRFDVFHARSRGWFELSLAVPANP